MCRRSCRKAMSSHDETTTSRMALPPDMHFLICTQSLQIWLYFALLSGRSGKFLSRYIRFMHIRLKVVSAPKSQVDIQFEPAEPIFNRKCITVIRAYSSQSACRWLIVAWSEPSTSTSSDFSGAHRENIFNLFLVKGKLLYP
jgi:hypothetical protein